MTDNINGTAPNTDAQSERPRVAPYGSWDSPIGTHMLVSGAVGISEVVPDGHGVFWAESRPLEAGRVAIMHHENGQTREVTPPKANVRTLMHEYGGGAWWANDNTLWYCDYDDQRLRELSIENQNAKAYAAIKKTEPRLLSAAPESPRAQRFADMRPTPDQHWIIAVCEQHKEPPKEQSKAQFSEPQNLITAIARDGSFTQIDLATGANFYGSICLSPDGKRIAWVQWDHPNMPWDTTTLMCADIVCTKSTIALKNSQRVAGGHEESVIQPLFCPIGQLHFLSDRDDNWQLYKESLDAPVLSIDGEIGYPPWVHGFARYAFKDNGEVVAAHFKNGVEHLDLKPDDTAFNSVRSSGSRIAFTSASWRSEASVFYDGKCVRKARDLGLSEAYLAEPEVLEFPTGTVDAPDTAYALYFAPANPDFIAPEDEKPPLIVLAHGGPTSAARSQLSLAQRFWTSRGFAVVDVNYRGSSGYGRAYRNKLNGQWGVADVQDCVAVAQYLADRGDVDKQRLIIRGGSAGGFTVLSALALHNTFTAGASLYGVADLEALATDTHKFESRYLDSLIGRWPEDKDVYAARSPINHLEGFSAPMIVLQGAEDTIVPPNQSRMIVDALDKRGLPVAYLEFEGEQHGFRKSDTIVTATLSELAFYGRVFGFKPAGPAIDLEIRNQ